MTSASLLIFSLEILLPVMLVTGLIIGSRKGIGWLVRGCAAAIFLGFAVNLVIAFLQLRWLVVGIGAVAIALVLLVLWRGRRREVLPPPGHPGID